MDSVRKGIGIYSTLDSRKRWQDLRKVKLNITPNPKKNDKIIVWDFKVGRYGNKKMVHLDYVLI